MSHNDLQFLPEVPPADVRQAELIDLVARFAPADGLHETLIAPLHLLRASAPAQRLPSVYEPGLCVAVQGCKQVMLNGEAFRYDPLHFLVISVTLPIMGQIVEATPAKPYLCVRLNIDPREVGALMLEAGESEPQGAGAQHGLRFASAGRGLHVSSVERGVRFSSAERGVRSSSAERGVRLSGAERGLRVLRVSDPLLDAVLRLLRLLRTPQDVRVLAPLAVREIYYRVLMSDLGPSLRELAVADSQSHRIARAIDLLKRRYAEPVRVEELAETAHMSSSSLHHHFKLVTAMSPLQFQKQLRLHQARRLMLTDGIDAAAAGHRVGYESPSQFSREYRRLFGAPPRAEIERVRSVNGPPSRATQTERARGRA